MMLVSYDIIYGSGLVLSRRLVDKFSIAPEDWPTIKAITIYVSKSKYKTRISQNSSPLLYDSDIRRLTCRMRKLGVRINVRFRAKTYPNSLIFSIKRGGSCNLTFGTIMHCLMHLATGDFLHAHKRLVHIVQLKDKLCSLKKPNND